MVKGINEKIIVERSTNLNLRINKWAVVEYEKYEHFFTEKVTYLYYARFKELDIKAETISLYGDGIHQYRINGRSWPLIRLYFPRRIKAFDSKLTRWDVYDFNLSKIYSPSKDNICICKPIELNQRGCKYFFSSYIEKTEKSDWTGAFISDFLVRDIKARDWWWQWW